MPTVTVSQFRILLLVCGMCAGISVVHGTDSMQHVASKGANGSWSGDAQIVSSSDGTESMIVPLGSPTGRVSFRVQYRHRLSTGIAYRGQARVIYTPAEVAVRIPNGTGWRFHLSGKALNPRQPAFIANLPILEVFGLARFSRVPFEVPPAMSYQGGCKCPGQSDECSGGGLGASECGYTCITSCEVSCGSGYSACCWCNQNTACCKCCQFGA
jgi:hypothetical protein